MTLIAKAKQFIVQIQALNMKCIVCGERVENPRHETIGEMTISFCNRHTDTSIKSELFSYHPGKNRFN